MATATRKRDSMGRFLPSSGKPSRAPRARDSQGRFLPGGTTAAKPKAKRKATKKRGSRSRSRKKTQIPVTHIALLLDNSASMRQHQRRAQQAFNEIVSTIREQAADPGQDVRVSFYTFGHSAKREFFNRSADSLPVYSYNPHEGRTALFEAIQKASRDFAAMADANDENVSFLVQIITDGQENKRNVSQPTIQRLIQDNQATDRWTYAISCPSGDVRTVERNLGIFGGNIDGWDVRDSQAMARVGTRHSRGVSRLLKARLTGVNSTKDYFAEVNVGRKTVTEVKRKLQPEDRKRFRMLTVDKARKIKDFIESKRLTFEKGRVFYQLNKPEIVQSYKEILLQDKNDPRVFYGGDQVRAVLGIPVGQKGKVSPGNLGEWNVWIQSTSVNRNLLAKMKVLYDQRDTIPKVPYRKY